MQQECSGEAGDWVEEAGDHLVQVHHSTVEKEPVLTCVHSSAAGICPPQYSGMSATVQWYVRHSTGVCPPQLRLSPPPAAVQLGLRQPYSRPVHATGQQCPVQYSAVQYRTVQCIILQCSVVQCSVVQCRQGFPALGVSWQKV